MEIAIAKILGENIARLRKEKGLTQAQLAEHLGITPAYISRVERGAKKLKLEGIIAAAEYFGVSCDALLRADPSDSAGENITKLLDGKSPTFCKAVEEIVKVCADHFEAK